MQKLINHGMAVLSRPIMTQDDPCFKTQSVLRERLGYQMVDLARFQISQSWQPFSITVAAALQGYQGCI